MQHTQQRMTLEQLAAEITQARQQRQQEQEAKKDYIVVPSQQQQIRMLKEQKANMARTYISALQDMARSALALSQLSQLEAVKRYQLREAEQEDILTRIIKGGDLTQLGLGQANDGDAVPDFDRFVDIINRR